MIPSAERMRLAKQLRQHSTGIPCHRDGGLPSGATAGRVSAGSSLTGGRAAASNGLPVDGESSCPSAGQPYVRP